MLWLSVLRHAFCYVALFFIHRILILPDIGAQTLSSDATRVLLMGLLSDLSVGCGIAFVLIVFRLPAFVSQLFLIVLSVLLMGHVSYVQFFHVTLRAWHVSYLWDWSFLKSSLTSTLLTRGILHIPLSFILALFVPPRFPRDRVRARVIASVVVLGVCILSNSLSQTWGRRSDLSEHLRNNVVVGLMVDGRRLFQRRSEVLLNNDDWAVLQKADPRIQPFRTTRTLTDAELAVLVEFLSFKKNQPPSVSNFGSQWSYLRNQLRQQFQTNTLATQPRYVIVVLMESARAVDSKLYRPETKGSMPELDAISLQGIRFANGYSNGTVTRAGAESTLCNSMASMDVNAMRNAPLSRPVCVAEMVRPFLDEHHTSYLFTYLHGGYLSFDRQNEFWSQNDFDIPIDILTQPQTLPRTDWGLSDKTFLSLTSDWFKDKASQNPSGLNFVFVQTMTNHYAWKLPSDADDDLKQVHAKTELKNLVTAQYQSRALAQWVQTLKNQGIWKNALVLFVGDHGVADGSEEHPSYYRAGNDVKLKSQQSDVLTKVYYTLSGGLVEQAVANCQQTANCSQGPVVADRFVLQSDFLPTLMDVMNIESVPLLGKSYFDEGSRLPPLIDVEDAVYIPELNHLWVSKKDFFKRSTDDSNFALLRAKQKLYLQLSLDGTLSSYLRRQYLENDGEE